MRFFPLIVVVSLLTVSLPASLWAQQQPATQIEESDRAAGEARPFPEQTTPPEQIEPSKRSAANQKPAGGTSPSSHMGKRIVFEALGGVGGTLLGSILGAITGFGVDALVLRGSVMGLSTALGLYAGGLLGAGWGVTAAGDANGGQASWWAPYLGALIAWPVGTALAGAYINYSNPSVLGPLAIIAFSPTVGSMLGYELSLKPTVAAAPPQQSHDLAANGLTDDLELSRPHLLQLSVQF